MDFGIALQYLKQGYKVARKGWNGKGMFIYLVQGSVYERHELRSEAAKHYPSVDAFANVRINNHIDMLAADGSIVVGWLASQTDMLAEDWEVLQ